MDSATAGVSTPMGAAQGGRGFHGLAADGATAAGGR
jgi:hypothetical protein